jgi:hypothetical protein
MPLPKHERTKEGAFRQANGNERAKNLAKDYPEFERVHPSTKLGDAPRAVRANVH